MWYGCDTAYCILALKCRDDGVHVIAVFLSDRGAVLPYFLNEGISTHNLDRIDNQRVFVHAVLDGRRDLKQVLAERLLRSRHVY